MMQIKSYLLYGIRIHAWKVLSLFLALWGEIFLLPTWLAVLRPHFVLLVLMYWILKSENQVGIGTVFFMGIILDLLTGSPLGEHALALTVVQYFVIRYKSQIVVFPVLKQVLFIFVLAVTYVTFIFWIQGAVAKAPRTLWFGVSVLSDVLLGWWFVSHLFRARNKIEWT